jgi:hypothetical protein
MRDCRRHKIRKFGQFTLYSGSEGGSAAGRQGKETRCSQGECMAPGIVGSRGCFHLQARYRELMAIFIEPKRELV